MSNILEPHTGFEYFTGQNKILKAIDMDEWKHSWHLKDGWRSNVQNLHDLKRVLQDKINKREEAIEQINEAIRLLDNRIYSVKEKRQERQAEAWNDLGNELNRMANEEPESPF